MILGHNPDNVQQQFCSNFMSDTTKLIKDTTLFKYYIIIYWKIWSYRSSRKVPVRYI